MSKTCLFCTLVIAAVAASSAHAMFAQPQAVPADRLIANTEAFIKENPKNLEGYYTLGRIHYLVFANQAMLVGAFEYGREEKLPRITPDWLLGNFLYMARRGHAQELVTQEMGFKKWQDIPRDKTTAFWDAERKKEQELTEQNWRPEPPPQKELHLHAAKAQEALKRATNLAPTKGLYVLTLASLYDQYVQYEQSHGTAGVVEPLEETTWETVRETYLKAYDLAIAEDLKSEHMPASGLQSLVSYEAGTRYVALMEKAEPLTDAEKKQVEKVRKNLARLKKLPRGGPVTPIIFSLEENVPLSGLLAPGSTALFDLDGNGSAERWPWVQPTTGILVWDPAGRGRITSGRQLFGSASWWLLFNDGYAALNVLDDSRDGKLSSAELDGIAVWFDRNSNGVSDPGEVTPVADMGIAAIATRSASREAGMLMNSAGILLKDGRALPSFDWITRPVQGAAMPLRME